MLKAMACRGSALYLNRPSVGKGAMGARNLSSNEMYLSQISNEGYNYLSFYYYVDHAILMTIQRHFKRGTYYFF